MEHIEQQYTVSIYPAAAIPSQPWWPDLHSTILESFLTKNHSVFPPTWTRLNTDPSKGAEGLVQELGNKGHLAVVFTQGGLPVACSGILPFRGENWVNEVGEKGEAKVASGEVTKSDGSSSEHHADQIADWETCCFGVHPSHRRQGLARRLLEALVAFIRPRGAKRLVSNYAIDETGDFWPRLGFEELPGAAGMLPKGFQTDPEKEGLRADVYFRMAAKTL